MRRFLGSVVLTLGLLVTLAVPARGTEQVIDCTANAVEIVCMVCDPFPSNCWAESIAVG